jgi:hypothetical protein
MARFWPYWWSGSQGRSPDPKTHSPSRIASPSGWVRPAPLRQALTRRVATFQTDVLTSAIDALRPPIDQASVLAGFWLADAAPNPRMRHGQD